MRIIAFIIEPKVIGKILGHLATKGLDARSPPGPRDATRPRHDAPGVLHNTDRGAVARPRLAGLLESGAPSCPALWE